MLTVNTATSVTAAATTTVVATTAAASAVTTVPAFQLSRTAIEYTRGRMVKTARTRTHTTKTTKVKSRDQIFFLLQYTTMAAVIENCNKIIRPRYLYITLTISTTATTSVTDVTMILFHLHTTEAVMIYARRDTIIIARTTTI
jgi:hypothetical protein